MTRACFWTEPFNVAVVVLHTVTHRIHQLLHTVPHRIHQLLHTVTHRSHQLLHTVRYTSKPPYKTKHTYCLMPYKTKHKNCLMPYKTKHTYCFMHPSRPFIFPSHAFFTAMHPPCIFQSHEFFQSLLLFQTMHPLKPCILHAFVKAPNPSSPFSPSSQRLPGCLLRRRRC